MTKHWVRFLHAATVHFGTIEDDRIQVYGGDMYADPLPTESTLLMQDVKLLTPTRPSKVIALWNNFHALAKKLNLSSPAEPLYVIKAPNAYLNPGETICKPSCDSKIVFEGELGVVIGKTCNHVTESDALDFVFGYTCVNDVTAAELLNKDPSFAQWVRAKGFDTFCPFGPVVATGLDPASLVVKTTLNGELRQEFPISDMHFSVAQLVSLISQDMSLYPGDVISCGTSIGVGSMKPGSVVEVEIAGIGKLSNRFE